MLVKDSSIETSMGLERRRKENSSPDFMMKKNEEAVDLEMLQNTLFNKAKKNVKAHQTILQQRMEPINLYRHVKAKVSPRRSAKKERRCISAQTRSPD